MTTNQTLKNLKHVWLLIYLTSAVLFAPLSFAQTAQPWRQLVPAEMQSLPEGILKWYITETDFLSRNVDPVRIYSPHNNAQDAHFKPEAKNVFDLLGLWMPASELKVFSTSESDELKKRFTRIRKGQQEVLFFIHPESLELYSKWLNAGYEVQYYKAAATASSRSLVVWKVGDEKNPLIAKVSLNKELAGTVRTIKGAEVAKSVGVTETLNGATNLPEGFLYMKESFSVIPEGLPRGGMILREFPPEMIDGTSHFIPLFALYGNKRPGFLLSAILNSKKSPQELIRSEILAPFAKMWTEMALEQGIVFEPHAQNVLVELKNNKFTGRFLVRDFGGVNIDFDFRKMRRLFVPEKLPLFLGSVFKNYSLEWYSESIRNSLYTFFEGGFLFNVRQALAAWQKNKWIPMQKFDPAEDFRIELARALKNTTGHDFKIGHQYENLEKIVYEYRLRSQVKKIGFYSGTFDPPHLGHVDIIKKSITELKLDEIYIVTGVNQTHKPEALDFSIRDQMAKAEFSKISKVRFINEEQIEVLKRGGIPALQEKLSFDFKKDTVYQIMGDDRWITLYDDPHVSFPRNFAVAVRSRDIKSLIPQSHQPGLKVIRLSPDYRQYSSTRFREALSKGQVPKQISIEVHNVIKSLKVYDSKLKKQCRGLFL